MTLLEKKTLLKKTRDATMIEMTRSLCPECKKLIDAQILMKGEVVYMRKRCPEHGWFESLLSSDAESYMNAFRYNKPGSVPLKFQTEVKDGCPFDCGLCPEHQQHSCVGIIEVTEACNLRCPTCFSNSSVGRFLTLQEVRRMIDTFVTSEGDPDILQFSGGEPTIHPLILEFVREAKLRGIHRVMINTNGVRIAREESFAKALGELAVAVYLQFDGFERETYLTLRGEDLREVKQQAIENLQRSQVNVVLVCTVQRGVNEHELGSLVDYAMETPAVRGIVFQPTFYSGRHPSFDAMDRTTTPDVIRSIVQQSKYGFKKADFFPIPCCYPTCSTASYVYMEGGRATPLPRVVNVAEYLDYVKNSTLIDIDQIVREALESLYSLGSVGGSEKLLSSYCTVCGIPINTTELKEKVKMIMIQPFMDAYNFDVKKVMKCCIHEILPDGRIIPFCAYNPIYRVEPHAG